EVVAKGESLGQGAMVWGHVAPVKHEVGIAVARSEITENLIVRAVFFEDEDDVLDQVRRSTAVVDGNRVAALHFAGGAITVDPSYLRAHEAVGRRYSRCPCIEVECIDVVDDGNGSFQQLGDVGRIRPGGEARATVRPDTGALAVGDVE